MNKRIGSKAVGKVNFVRFVGLFSGVLLITACRPAILDPAGPVAAAQRTILLNSLAIMLVITVPTMVLTLAFAWWFRESNSKARYRPDWAYSGRLELLVWSIPLLVIMFLSGITWIGSHQLDPREPLQSETQPIAIDVVALNWKWLFIYPAQNIASVNYLAVPVGTPIEFRITSATVMNSFFVPQLGSQIYAMAGMTSRLNLQADQIGRYDGLSANYSGQGFADMDFSVQAMDTQAFSTWVTQISSSGPVLDRETFSRLMQDNAIAEPHTYREAPGDLFEFALSEAGRSVEQNTVEPEEDL